MRFQGSVTEWRDEQGFGFVTQDGDGKRVFIHVRKFAARGKRPSLGDVLTYRIGMENGRVYAQDIAYAASVASASRKSFNSSRDGSMGMWLASLYLTVAKSNARRTPERQLHLLDLMGGWPAGLMAQRSLHHNSGKASFQTVYKVTVLLHLAGVIWLFSPYGAPVCALMSA